MSTPSLRRLGAIALAATFVVGACTGGTTPNASGPASTDPDATSAGPVLTGTVLVDGSSTVGPLSEVAAELFEEWVSENGGDARVTVAISGTSAGFGKFCNGETDMNDASRTISDSEVEQCGQNEIAFENIQVANDALALVVNPQNPVECLTVEQATQIWDAGPESGPHPVQAWSDIDGLDLPADFLALATDETRQLGRQLYGPGTDSGTFDFFTEVINGESGRIRTDYNDIGEDDNAAVTAVSGIPHSIGYIPYSYFTEVGDVVKPLSIDGGNGCVEPTLENVLTGTYIPLGRPLFVYASDKALARPEALAFMEFYIDNAPEIATLAGFVPLSDEQIAEQVVKIDQLVGR